MSDTASNNIVALDRPTTDAALQRDLVTAIKGVLDLAERGEICSVIMVVMKPDHQFRIMREGTHPRRSRLMKKHKPLILRGELTTGAYKGWHVLSRTKSNQEVVVRDLAEAIVIVKAMSTEPPK